MFSVLGSQLIWRVSGRGCIDQVCQIGHLFLSILKAPLADMQSIDFSADELFWIEGRVPCLEEDISKHDIVDVEVGRLLAIALCHYGGRQRAGGWW